MDWRAPFNALNEIFPQVDGRIIKAIALEHANDIDSAVEFILNEVIPKQNEKTVTRELDSNDVRVDGLLSEQCHPFLSEQTVSTSSQESISDSVTKDYVLNMVDEFLLTDSNAIKNTCELASSFLADNALDDLKTNIIQSNSPPAPMILQLPRQLSDGSFSGTSSSFHSFNQGQSKDDGFTSMGSSSHLDGSIDGKEQCLTMENEVGCLDSGKKIEFERSNDGSLNSNCYLSAGSPDVPLPGMNSRVSCSDDLEASISRLPSTNITSVVTFEGKNQGIEGTLVKRSISSPKSIIDEGTRESLDACDSSEKKNMDSLPVFEPTDETTHIFSAGSKDNGLDVKLHTESSFHIAEDSSLSGSRISSSSQVVNTDTLEGFVNEAKKNKESLMEAMDIIRSLRIKADREEIAAQQAKDEAAKGGSDTLAKVEELRQMLSRAREANDMHAGEVYGEKAILATEARELRSRLAQLVAEKEKAFCVIDQMRENLQARIDAAKREKEAAEEEKMKKEESACKVLAMEEALMAKVANDSRELELEAEANSKLREFLIDRGHIVDALQGEMAVLCEDVKLLKEQIDGGITTVGNGLLSIQSPISARHQSMKEHSRCQSSSGLFNQEASTMSELQTTSDEMNLQSSSLKSYGRTDDISMSRLSLLHGNHGAEDTVSVHSGALHESIESMNMLVSVASSGRLSDFIPDMDCTQCSDVERDYLNSRIKAFVPETDTECQDAGLQSSNLGREAKEQHCLKLDCDDDGWQFLDNFCRESRKSGSNSGSSNSAVKTKQS